MACGGNRSVCRAAYAAVMRWIERSGSIRMSIPGDRVVRCTRLSVLHLWQSVAPTPKHLSCKVFALATRNRFTPLEHPQWARITAMVMSLAVSLAHACGEACRRSPGPNSRASSRTAIVRSRCMSTHAATLRPALPLSAFDRSRHFWSALTSVSMTMLPVRRASRPRRSR